jgi:hypothetical protein
MFDLLKFQPFRDNAKLKVTLAEFARLTGNADARGYAFSLPSGFTCGRIAQECLTYAHPKTGKLSRGKDSIYYCFSSVSEAYSPEARRARWGNWSLLQKLWNYAGSDYIDIANLISEALPVNADLVRVHVGGEFPGSDFGREYMRAWFHVARSRPDARLYAYTKNVQTYLDVRDEQPANFNVTMSRGGLHDHLIDSHKLKNARVIWHPDQANGMPIDHNDINAIFGDHSFNLLLHGMQPAKSPASAAIKRLKTENVKFSYSRK